MKKETCKHNLRRVKKEIIPGYFAEVEICDECGLETINPLEAEKLLSMRDSKGINLNPEDTILLLLGVDPEVPIKETLFMKEAFLLEKEAAGEIGLNVNSLNFYPDKFGPFSRLLENNLQEMDGDLITIIRFEGGKKIIKLTEKGEKVAKSLIEKISPDKIKKLHFTRLGWDQYGNRGILKRVYRDYPLYASKSKIKDNILK